MHNKRRMVMRAGLAVAAAVSIIIPAGVAAAAPATVPIKAPAAGPATPAGLKLEKPIKRPATAANLRKGNPRKGGISTRSTTCSPSACYDYAGKGDTFTAGTVTGVEIAMTADTPGVRTWDYHSLGELSAQNLANDNIIEVGWRVSPGANTCNAGQAQPCLFVYSWVNGVAQGYGTGFQQVSGRPINLFDSVPSNSGIPFKVSWDYFDATCGCTPGWWLKYSTGGAAWAYVGVYPETVWTSQGASFTDADLDFVQAFGEVAASQRPSQTGMGANRLPGDPSAVSMTGYGLHGASAPTPAWDWHNVTRPELWNAAITTGQNFNFGGPGGWDYIASTTTTTPRPNVDDCPGVGIGPGTGGLAPSGWGSMCTYSSRSGSVPIGPVVTSIDEIASTACRGNVGTAAGYAPIRNIAITGPKTVTFYPSGNCTGTGTNFDHGRLALPAGLAAAANLSYRINSTLAVCASGYPTSAPTC